MAQLGLHPRVANMVERGHALGLGRLACLIGSLLGERDVLAAHAPSADVALRLDALRSPDSGAASCFSTPSRCHCRGDTWRRLPHMEAWRYTLAISGLVSESRIRIAPAQNATDGPHAQVPVTCRGRAQGYSAASAGIS